MVASFEQQPAGLGQERLPPLATQVMHLGPADGLDGLTHVHRDMEAVEDVQRVAGLLGHDLEVRLPHVAAHEAECLRVRLAEPTEEPEQRLHAALRTDPQQSLPSRVDLVDQGQVPMAVLPLDLVDADRFDAVQVHVGAAPLHGHRDRAKDVIPRRVERPRDLAPTQALRPTSQEPRIGGRQRVFPLRPRHGFDADATGGTLHASEQHRDAPQRHEVETAKAGGIITEVRDGDTASTAADSAGGDRCPPRAAGPGRRPPSGSARTNPRCF